MYQPSQTMPLNSYQIINPAENQTDFKAGQIIRFMLPRSVGFWDPHTSRLQLEVSAKNSVGQPPNYKMCFAQECGAASIIDMIRVSQNGVILSETTEYSTLSNIFVNYSDSLSIQQRNSTQNGARGYISDPLKLQNQAQTTESAAVMGELLNSTTVAGLIDTTQKKFQLELRGVGLFELMSVVPQIALGDVLVEIRLVQNNVQGLKVHPATSYPHAATGIGNASVTAVLTPPFVGFTNLADSPFAVGMNITPVAADGSAPTTAVPITGLAQDSGTGVITITHQANGGAIGAQPRFVVSTGVDGQAAVDPTIEFVVNRASMVLQVIRPPVQYIESIAKKVQEGLMLDLNTYTTYRNTVQSGIRNQTLEIPSFVSRARGILTVPRFQAGTAAGLAVWTFNNATDWDIQGQYRQLQNYRTQVGEVYYPNQPVQLDQMVGTQKTHFSAQHIVELEKCLRACNIPLRNLKKVKQNFVIPRCLAKYGATVNLDKGLRVYLEYDGVANPNVNLDAVSYVNHVNRVIITPAGVEVLS